MILSSISDDSNERRKHEAKDITETTGRVDKVKFALENAEQYSVVDLSYCLNIPLVLL